MAELKKLIGKGVTESYLLSDIEEIRNNLIGYGVDLEENAKRQEKLMKQLKFKIKASLNKQTNWELLSIAADSYKEALCKGLEKPVAYLNTLIKQNNLSVSYSNLDKLSKSEIQEIIKDQNLLEIIELLEKEQKR